MRSYCIMNKITQSIPTGRCELLNNAEPPVPARSRKFNTAWNNTVHQNPRMHVPNDKLKLKHIPEDKIRCQDSKLSNIELKPFQSVKLPQKTKVLNTEIIPQPLKTAVKQLTQKPLAAFKKLATQKMKLSTQAANLAQKAKPSTQSSLSIVTNIEETIAPKVKKMYVPNAQVQKTKPQEITVAQKTKIENNTPTLKIKSQESDDSNAINIKNSSQQDTKPKENSPGKTQPAVEMLSVQMTKDVQEDNKMQETTISEASISNKIETDETVPSKTAAASEKRELSQLLARAVEDELQDVMIQVWQELPDDPQGEGDRIAVDKLRNEAGDDLRRVLGLNITKRLLNVYNNLFVKVQFTCRPQIGCLTNFLNEYHISKFKRIDKNSNTFAAQMETMEDFDKICTVKEIMCGEAKVSVTPCYKFTQCPENLKTIYDDTYFYEDAVPVHSQLQRSENSAQKTKVTVTNENVHKLNNKPSNIKPKCNDQKAEVRVSNENVVKPVTTAENNEAKCGIENVEILSSNVSILKPNTSVGNMEKKVSDEPIEAETKTSIISVRMDIKDIKSDTSVKKNKENSTDSSKVNRSKEIQVINIVTNVKDVKSGSKYIVKDSLESDDDDDFGSGIPEYEMESDEELDDEDILALMSEGVVLDECSGSEDEK